jgi:Uma2 family endonuclease
MVAVIAVAENQQVDIPDGIKDLPSFLKWAESDMFPERGRICYLKDWVWVDMTMEEMNHNQLKGIFAIVLGNLVLTGGLGRYFHDRMRLSNLLAGLASEPDGMFLSWDTLRTGRAKLLEGDVDSPIRVEATPDMALEVVSPSSVQKDTIELRQRYWEAGILEYWLVDARGGRLAFHILRRVARGYVAVRPQAGWVKSAVFGKRLRLTQQVGADGYAQYRLIIR